MMNKALIYAAGETLRNAHRVLVVCHLRPDGDAIGSLLALGLSLQTAGKNVQMVCVDGIPTSFRHLPGSQLVQTRPSGSFDFICVVDTSEFKRTGGALEGLPQPDINIDHHITNLGFARYDLVDPQAVSTTEILARLLPEFGLPMTLDVASALLTGLVTDTLGFRTANITPAALRLAADLMELGANLPELYYRGLVGRSYEAARYWGAGLGRLQREDRLVWTSLSLADRKAAGYLGKDDADLINVLSAIDEMDVAIVIVEQTAQKVKVSWRARDGFDVSRVAMQFGGGGHAAAAGAEIAQPLEQAELAVLQATRQAFSQPINAAI